MPRAALLFAKQPIKNPRKNAAAMPHALSGCHTKKFAA
jgi:hypothetical protein